MKKSIFILVAILNLTFLNAQQINSKGLYVTSNNELFNGVIISHLNDIQFKLTVKDGVIEGEADYFYASGNLMEKGFFTDGKKDKKWTRYNENGTVSAIAFYNLGKKHGNWVVFDNDGKKRFEMSYENGEKTGTWTNWDENGTIVGTKNYQISN